MLSTLLQSNNPTCLFKLLTAFSEVVPTTSYKQCKDILSTACEQLVNRLGTNCLHVCYNLYMCVFARVYDLMPGQNITCVSLDEAGFTVWSPWSACSEECSFGESERERTCTDSTLVTCNGTSRQNLTCYAGPCPGKKPRLQHVFFLLPGKLRACYQQSTLPTADYQATNELNYWSPNQPTEYKANLIGHLSVFPALV